MLRHRCGMCWLGRWMRTGSGRGAAGLLAPAPVQGVLGFSRGRVLLPGVREPFTPLGDHLSGEQLDWQVIVRVAAHCRRRYMRACDCRVPGTVMAPGPPKAVTSGGPRRPALPAQRTLASIPHCLVR
jgi:hypothetical protein